MNSKALVSDQRRNLQEAAQQAVSADRLRREYVWRALPAIVPIIVASLAKVGGGLARSR